MSVMDKVKAAWGEPLPDWVKVMAERCDTTSQRKVAEEIRYSPAVVNLVLRNTYKGNLNAIEGAVEGAFMNGTVWCCAMDIELRTQQCMMRQRDSYKTHNHIHRAFHQACRYECPISNVRVNKKNGR